MAGQGNENALSERSESKGFVGRAERKRADVAQLAERVLGKDEVTGSIPVIGSNDTKYAGNT